MVRLLARLMGAALLAAAVISTPAAAGPLPDWVKELVAPSGGDQDHVVGEELC
jgi:hypothetical protein